MSSSVFVRCSVFPIKTHLTDDPRSSRMCFAAVRGMLTLYAPPVACTLRFPKSIVVGWLYGSGCTMNLCLFYAVIKVMVKGYKFHLYINHSQSCVYI